MKSDGKWKQIKSDRSAKFEYSVRIVVEFESTQESGELESMKKVRELKKAETKFNRKQNFFQTKGIGSQTRTKNLVQVEASVLSEVCSGRALSKSFDCAAKESY